MAGDERSQWPDGRLNERFERIMARLDELTNFEESTSKLPMALSETVLRLEELARGLERLAGEQTRLQAEFREELKTLATETRAADKDLAGDLRGLWKGWKIVAVIVGSAYLAFVLAVAAYLLGVPIPIPGVK